MLLSLTNGMPENQMITVFFYRYIQVETAFFWRWWTEQDEQMKDLVKELVNAGI